MQNGTYDVWYTDGIQKKLMLVEAQTHLEARMLSEEILAQKREIVSIAKRPDVHRKPQSKPYPEFLPEYEAN